MRGLSINKTGFGKLTLKVIDDGVCQRAVEFQPDGKIVSQLQQRDRGVILERNNELRKNPDALRNASFMGMEYSVPLADYHTIMKAIRKNNPGCGSKDMSSLLRGWLERYGHAYRVRPI